MNKSPLLALVLLTVSPTAYSSPTAANTAELAAPSAEAITLGNSVVPLEQGWKFQPGDSPWVNGGPLWAQPDYDDARWAAMDLTPGAGTVDLLIGTSGYVPGWTRRGYPNLIGYAWYRLLVHVASFGQPLWLKMPNNFDDAFQLYANGRFVGQFGDFSQDRVTMYYSQPTSFALPKPGQDGTIVLAMRFYMSPASPLLAPDVGGPHTPPVLGLASTVRLMQASERESLLRTQFGTLLVAFLQLLTAPLALWAWLYNRKTRLWVWLFLALAGQLILNLVSVTGALATLFSQAVGWSSVAVSLPLFLLFWWHWFELEEKRWIPRAGWLMAAAATVAGLLAYSPFLGWNFMSRPALQGINDLAIGLTAGISLLQVIILIEGLRRDRLEALLPAVPILLGLFNAFWSYLLVTFHVPNEFFPFGLGIYVANVIDFLTITIIFALALRRFMRTQVRESLARQEVKRDLEQARQLQQRVLVPETITSPCFTVTAEYRPAQTLGGDFFQTLTRPDGALLVVIGDVSGKGVSASMLVAVLVGAIRGQAEHSFDPQAMLAMLNRRMLGRSGEHFATCLAAQIAPDGVMRLANAGHLPPYLNGAEMELEGSLPLGVTENVEYPAQTFRLKPSDRLTFLTDGVVEAKNAAKEMFGFDRARAMSAEQAAVIAQQAQSFGQQDDITVVRVAFGLA